jgi:small subunit ribosomal protein S7
MPRKGEVPKRRVLPDPKFTDAPPDMRRRITKFINVVMIDGKKPVAEHDRVQAPSTWWPSGPRTIL